MHSLIALILAAVLIAIVCSVACWAVRKLKVSEPPANWIIVAIVVIGVLIFIDLAWPFVGGGRPVLSLIAFTP